MCQTGVLLWFYVLIIWAGVSGAKLETCNQRPKLQGVTVHKQHEPTQKKRHFELDICNIFPCSKSRALLHTPAANFTSIAIDLPAEQYRILTILHCYFWIDEGVWLDLFEFFGVRGLIAGTGRWLRGARYDLQEAGVNSQVRKRQRIKKTFS